MNISTLLHHELMIVARERAIQKYDAPKFTLREEIAAIRDKRVRKLDINPLDSARSHYVRIATLMEYQQLILEVDNECFRIIEAHKFGSQEKFVKRFMRFYETLAQHKVRKAIKDKTTGRYKVVTELHPLDKNDKKDAARYTYLHILDEREQNMTFGVIYRPDASFVKDYDMRNISRSETRKERNASRYAQEVRDRVLYPTMEATEHGTVRSTYAVTMNHD